MTSPYPNAAQHVRTPLSALPHFGCLLLLLLALLPGTAPGQVVISIPDPHLEAAVRSALGKSTGDLTSEDMLELRQLGAPAQDINNLSGLEWALNLQHLNLVNNAVASVAPLAGLINLQSLLMDHNSLTSGAPLAGLTNLTALELNNNAIADTSWLANLTQLQTLSLMFNPLGNASVVARLTNLTELHLNGTSLSDANFVRGLDNLTILGLGDNNIHDGSPIAGLTKLVFLGIGANPISNWDFMRGLTNLRTLYLFSDSLRDISFLAGLHNLAWLRLSDNHISDTSPLAGLSNLQYLDLSWNSLGSCQELAGLSGLTNLDLSWNNLTNLNGLGGLRNLVALNLGNNQITDGSPLTPLSSLQSLDLTHNRLANLDFAQGLTSLSSLDASHNRLTDIQGLFGAGSLTSVALSDNLLLLVAGSPANNVVMALQSRGVAVDVSSQSVPYVPTNGTYYGLVYAEGALTSSNAGTITLTLTAQRKYTGKLLFGGASYPLTGSLHTDGTDSQTVQRGKQLPLRVSLLMQGTDYLTGKVAANGQTVAANLLGFRALFDGKTKLAPQAGRYTMMVAGSNSAALPAGNGYGTLTVSPAGLVKFTGSLADGTKVSQSAWVSADGQWPFYTPLYSGHGALLGWLSLTNGPTFGGDLAWMKPQLKNKRYAAGFAWLTQANGARYSPPGKGSNVFALTNCNLNLTLTGGDLKGDLVNPFTLNSKNQVKALPVGSKMSLSFTPSTGRFQGRAVDPVTHKGVSFGGVVLQSQTNGCGYFLGSSTSGQVLLSP